MSVPRARLVLLLRFPWPKQFIENDIRLSSDTQTDPHAWAQDAARRTDHHRPPGEPRRPVAARGQRKGAGKFFTAFPAVFLRGPPWIAAHGAQFPISTTHGGAPGGSGSPVRTGISINSQQQERRERRPGGRMRARYSSYTVESETGTEQKVTAAQVHAPSMAWPHGWLSNSDT